MNDKIYTCILSESIKAPSLISKWSLPTVQNLLAPLTKRPQLEDNPDFKQCHKSLCITICEKNCVRVLVSHLVFRWYWLYHTIPKIGRISAIKLSWQRNTRLTNYDVCGWVSKISNWSFNNWQSLKIIIISCNLHLELLGIIFHLAICELYLRKHLINLFLETFKVLNKICFPLSSLFVIKLFLPSGRSL